MRKGALPTREVMRVPFAVAQRTWGGRRDVPPAQVFGAIEALGGQEPRRVELAKPAYDWSLYGLLLAGFPLGDGYAARFPPIPGLSRGVAARSVG